MVTNVMLSVMAWAATIRNTIAETAKSEDGQGLLEYVVLAGFIGIVAAAAFFGLGLQFIIGDFAERLSGCLGFDEGTCTTPF